MKLHIHCILLIIYIGTLNTSVLDDVRINVMELVKKLHTKDLPRTTNIDIKHLMDSYNIRNNERGYITKEISHNKNPAAHVFVNDDVKKPSEPELRPMKRLKRLRYYNEAAPEETKINHYISRPLIFSFINEEDNTQVRDIEDVALAKQKSQILKKVKLQEDKLNFIDTSYFRAGMFEKPRYHMDPVLNILPLGLRRKMDKITLKPDEESESKSDTSEEYDWKELWTAHWDQKKMEAINQIKSIKNSSISPDEFSFDMVSARPWGVHCGDPNQHDMTWGTCTLSNECEPELRIFRGDVFCGQTLFICCAVLHSDYDVVQGLDVSLEDKGLSTNEEERQAAGRHTDAEKKRKDKYRKIKKRRNERRKRKKQMTKNIRKIIREITRILERHYKNGTMERRKKTKILKKFIRHLKRQYRKDRNSVKELHETTLMTINENLLKKLKELKVVNDEFMKNDTFRNIIDSGSMTKKGARMLIQAYPELQPYINMIRSNGISRRAISESHEDYDVEYDLYE